MFLLKKVVYINSRYDTIALPKQNEENKMIKNSEELVPGKIFYEVCGVNRTLTKAGEFTKHVVIGNVYDHLMGFDGYYRKAQFFPVSVEYVNYDGKVVSYDTERSTNDMGVFSKNEKRNVYNLNRGFWTKEEAEEFIKELQADKFSDPDCQAYAERLPAAEHFIRQKEELEMWSDFGWDNDYYDDFDEE